jgi:hypothetical protein
MDHPGRPAGAQVPEAQATVAAGGEHGPAVGQQNVIGQRRMPEAGGPQARDSAVREGIAIEVRTRFGWSNWLLADGRLRLPVRICKSSFELAGANAHGQNHRDGTDRDDA